MLMLKVAESEYAATLEHLKTRVRQARYTAQRAANTELLRLYWHIGATIVARQETASWGSGVIGRLAEDLRDAFPTMKGFSRANLFTMRRFAQNWDEAAIVQRAVGQLPWGHVIELLSKIDDAELRDWYAEQDVTHGWSRPVLVHHITSQLHTRLGNAPSNFAKSLDRMDSELAQHITKDPFTLDFLAIDADTSERDLENRLTSQIVQTLHELGPGFAFVGRQVHFEVDGDDFYVDLLFFHVTQLRYVVLELKTTKFDPRDAGQLGFYVALVDAQLRISDVHRPTIGILLVKDRNETW
ncbi:PDDEXK nuclease domain-containing protein [Herbiconiux sp. KACC 21604]|uniref:PDDEXK nuclease domain-containing protein n=1 Tax=unclassified Herbiconiux TaxID=2618217 RepID=UPI00352FEE4E|nr:PDDEXK nuclease domain-containing protein [Herbiconiux sp. KACC 21604]